MNVYTGACRLACGPESGSDRVFFFLGRWTMVMELLNKAGGTAEQHRMLNSGEAFDNSGNSWADADVYAPSHGGVTVLMGDDDDDDFGDDDDDDAFADDEEEAEEGGEFEEDDEGFLEDDEEEDEDGEFAGDDDDDDDDDF